MPHPCSLENEETRQIRISSICRNRYKLVFKENVESEATFEATQGEVCGIGEGRVQEATAMYSAADFIPKEGEDCCKCGGDGYP